MHGTLRQRDMGNIGIDACWYALLVASGTERKACIWLRRRQYEPYWPRFMGQVRLNRHRRQMRWRSVIPGYLFLPIFTEANWPLIEEAPGVHGIMSNGEGGHIEIPEAGKDGIEQIRAIEAALNASPIAAADGVPFKAGQQIRLKLLDNIEGKIISVEKGRKLIVEVFFLGAVRAIPYPTAEADAI